jgi:hypothetical protein
MFLGKQMHFTLLGEIRFCSYTYVCGVFWTINLFLEIPAHFGR